MRLERRLAGEASPAGSPSNRALNRVQDEAGAYVAQESGSINWIISATANRWSWLSARHGHVSRIWYRGMTVLLPPIVRRLAAPT